MLIISGVFLTLGMVALINLEPPKNAVKTLAAKEPAARAPQRADVPQIKASPEASTPNPAEANRSAGDTAQPPGASTAVAPEPSTSTAPAPSASASPISEADIAVLKLKNLLLPVAGVTANQLRDTFYDGRSEGRQHQALDIMAPAGTPVLAVADGKVARLFQSDKGGITLYQLDASGLYYYYYAHLQRYADGIIEGKDLKRGDVIAYVGDTGNAGVGNFHLHFAITKPLSPGKWSGGTPINPYPFFVSR